MNDKLAVLSVYNVMNEYLITSQQCFLSYGYIENFLLFFFFGVIPVLERMMDAAFIHQSIYTQRRFDQANDLCNVKMNSYIDKLHNKVIVRKRLFKQSCVSTIIVVLNPSFRKSFSIPCIKCKSIYILFFRICTWNQKINFYYLFNDYKIGSNIIYRLEDTQRAFEFIQIVKEHCLAFIYGVVRCLMFKIENHHIFGC